MLSDADKAFLVYWEKNRDKERRFFKQLLLGIPVGLLFAIPIVISLASGWHKRATMIANTPDFNPGVLLAALLLIVGFVAVFSRKYNWDQREQKYLELKAREESQQGGNNI